MNPGQLKNLLQAALFAAAEPQSLERLLAMLRDDDRQAHEDARKPLDCRRDEAAMQPAELRPPQPTVSLEELLHTQQEVVQRRLE